MVSLTLVLTLLTGCSALGALSALSGGPQVNTNAQIGQTNTQTLGTTQNQTITRPQARTIEQNSGDTAIETERVEKVTINNEVPIWVWLLMILGWLLPSPSEIGRMISKLFRRKG